jgi:hypothetical protein
MAMRLADDEVTITFPSGRVFVLRASLRAAFILYRKYGSYAALSNAIVGGTLGAYCDVITAACTDREELVRFRATTDMIALRDAILDNRDKLLEFVLMLAGGKPSGDQPSEPAKPITFDDYHTKLFRIATGWLGWSPTDAWNATPAEIINAQQGRLEMLSAIFGSKKDETIDASDANERAKLNALGDLSVTVMSEAK